MVVAQDTTLKLLNEGHHGRISRVEQQNLLGRDYGLDVLEVDHDGPFPAQHGGRVREERVEDPEVAGRETSPPHDRVLSGLHYLGLAGGVEEEPGTHSGGLLP